MVMLSKIRCRRSTACNGIFPPCRKNDLVQFEPGSYAFLKYNLRPILIGILIVDPILYVVRKEILQLERCSDGDCHPWVFPVKTH
jgi:hypothetical protein